MIDNSKLEALIADFMQDKSNENFTKVMEQLEKTVLYLPAMLPDKTDKNKIVPCLIKNEKGEQALPVFSSPSQIPDSQKSPAVATLPFFNCVSMAMANEQTVQAVVLNPFTHNIVLPKQVLEIAKKRGAMLKPKAVKMTQPQFHQFAHRRLTYELLPVFLYDKKKEGLEKMQKEEGAFLISLLTALYPKEIKVPYTEDDFSFMTLNVTENMQITRIDMPEKNGGEGSCHRIYVVWKRDVEQIDYYTIEQTKDGDKIGRVRADKKHEQIKEAPDNGAEIETVMNLAAQNE
ncbi:MAG: SseB family protein [Bacillus sp. (in: Bacteria)]|nr:SseB family protein [Bacillus sp. (in: firmicutes)]MCM1428109.1 SseB family protein [Eubacterium sp.]